MHLQFCIKCRNYNYRLRAGISLKPERKCSKRALHCIDRVGGITKQIFLASVTRLGGRSVFFFRHLHTGSTFFPCYSGRRNSLNSSRSPNYIRLSSSGHSISLQSQLVRLLLLVEYLWLQHQRWRMSFSASTNPRCRSYTQSRIRASDVEGPLVVTKQIANEKIHDGCTVFIIP